jgi:hypothetical protein
MRWQHLVGYGAVAAMLACEAPAATDNQAMASGLTPAALAQHAHHMDGVRGVVASDAQLFDLRRVTDQFHSISQAENVGYAAFGPCFSDPTLGGMGFHWANQQLIGDSTVDANKPELLVYQPLPDGGRKLAAVEYIVFVDEWHAKGNVNPPSLFGQEFHVNPTLLQKPFYLLHVWSWVPNPAGTFMDFNPTVSCS